MGPHLRSNLFDVLNYKFTKSEQNYDEISKKNILTKLIEIKVPQQANL